MSESSSTDGMILHQVTSHHINFNLCEKVESWKPLHEFHSILVSGSSSFRIGGTVYWHGRHAHMRGQFSAIDVY